MCLLFKLAPCRTIIFQWYSATSFLTLLPSLLFVGLEYQKRWSVVVGEEGVYSTEAHGLHHKPIQAIGGGDAWLAGFVDALVEQRYSFALYLFPCYFASQNVLHLIGTQQKAPIPSHWNQVAAIE
jgi:hypothetical protein